jgi:hypothetical protein
MDDTLRHLRATRLAGSALMVRATNKETADVNHSAAGAVMHAVDSTCDPAGRGGGFPQNPGRLEKLSRVR